MQQQQCCRAGLLWWSLTSTAKENPYKIKGKVKIHPPYSIQLFPPGMRSPWFLTCTGAGGKGPLGSP